MEVLHSDKVCTEKKNSSQERGNYSKLETKRSYPSYNAKPRKQPEEGIQNTTLTRQQKASRWCRHSGGRDRRTAPNMMITCSM